MSYEKGNRVPSISDEDIQKVRAATDIVTLFSERVPLRQKGRDFWCCCPFHDENTPSCKIDPSTQQFYCFGCHEHGDAFSFVMKTEDIDFPDAVRRLADRAHIEIKELTSSGPSRSYKERLRGVCCETRDFYHMQLMRLKSSQADEARAYLAKRNLGKDVPRTWKLGFAEGHGTLVRYLSSKGYSAREMVDANVAVQYDNGPLKDRFFNRIMFPIHDDQGECIAFGGRVIGSGEPKYLNSQETPLFHKSRILYGLDQAKPHITQAGEAIVVEGYTDVIALHKAGIGQAVATLGTALTTQHLRALARHATRRVVYLFDGDEAGRRATDRALGFIDESMTPEAGVSRVELYACTLPDNLDPADFVEHRGVEALRAELAAAQPLLAFGIDRHIARFDISTPEGRTAAFADALALLAPIKSSLLAKEYAVHIAGRLRIRENDALEKLQALPTPRKNRTDQGLKAPYSRQISQRKGYPSQQGTQQTKRFQGNDGRIRHDARVRPASSAQHPYDSEVVPYDESAAYGNVYEGGAFDHSSSDMYEHASEESFVPVSSTEKARRRFEAALIRVCAHNPSLALAHAEALLDTNWHVDEHRLLAATLVAFVADNPEADAVLAAGALSEALPDAPAYLITRESEQHDPAAFSDFLIEELALGDLTDEIESYKAQLAHPQSLTEEEYDVLFQSVSVLQQDLASRLALHRRSTYA